MIRMNHMIASISFGGEKNINVCMIDNNVKILRENDLKYVFEYIDLQYGRKSL